jgi:hypothetical protein
LGRVCGRRFCWQSGLLSLAVERKVLRSRRLRVDTTIVEADIRSPTLRLSVGCCRLDADTA